MQLPLPSAVLTYVVDGDTFQAANEATTGEHGTMMTPDNSDRIYNDNIQ